MSQENVQTLRGVRYPVSLPSERASQRRTLDERLFLRFPILFRMFGDLWMRLPTRSRLRRLLLTRLMRRGYAAGNRRDFQVMCAGLDRGIVYRAPREGLAPDLDAVLHGHDGYLQVWRSWLDAFEDIRFEPEELLDLGDRLLVTTHLRGRGSGSGVAVSRPVFQLLEFRRGLVIRQEDFQDRSKALAAAGLSE
jgi:ketosteroid isomerase-like protein